MAPRTRGVYLLWPRCHHLPRKEARKRLGIKQLMRRRLGKRFCEFLLARRVHTGRRHQLDGAGTMVDCGDGRRPALEYTARKLSDTA